MKQIKFVKQNYLKIFTMILKTKSQLMSIEFESETSFSAKYFKIRLSTVTSTSLRYESFTFIKQKYEESGSSAINFFRQSSDASQSEYQRDSSQSALVSQDVRVQRFYQRDQSEHQRDAPQSKYQRDSPQAALVSQDARVQHQREAPQLEYQRDSFQSEYQRVQSEYSGRQQQSEYQPSYDDFNERSIRKKITNRRQQINDFSDDLYEDHFRQRSNKLFENHSRQLFQLDKLYKEENKFSETSDNFDFKLTIFHDKCRLADLSSTIYIQDVESMLIDEALAEFYAAKYQKRDYDDFIKEMRDFYEESE